MFSGLPLVAVDGVIDFAARRLVPGRPFVAQHWCEWNDCRDYGAVADRQLSRPKLRQSFGWNVS